MIPLWISLAGGAGAVTRFVVDGHIRTNLYRSFPWGTTLINATGSLLLGALTGLALYHHVSTNLRLILGTGFCGGYTTFSTASFEAVRLIEEKRLRAAWLHLTSNACLTLGLAFLGLWFTLVVLSSLYWIDAHQKTWRWLHYLNYFIILAVFLHALGTGSDLRYGTFRTAWVVVFLLLLIAVVHRLLRAGTLRYKDDADDN